MRSGHLLSLGAVALSFVLASCAGVSPKVSTGNGGNGGPGTRVIGTYDGGRPDIPTIEVGDPSKCGNGVMDNGESCDDGNKNAGDGCSAICQVPAGGKCTAKATHSHMQ